MIKAVIFDLDGTLSYTLDSIARSGNEALEAIGLNTLPVDNYKYYCGDGSNELVRRILKDSGDAKCSQFEALKDKYLMFFEKYADYKVRPYDGVPELIHLLKEKGYKLAVLSNKPHIQCIEVVEKLYGKGIFDYIQGNTPEIARKPSPDGAIIIANALNIRPCDFLYVGDTATDMTTGNGAGMNTVGVLWGYRDEKELTNAGAKYIVSEPSEILAMLSSN